MFGNKKESDPKGLISFEGIDFIIKRRNVRYFRVEFSPEKAVIVTPYFSNVGKFLEENRVKILKKKKQLSERLKKSREISLNFRTLDELVNVINQKIKIYSYKLEVKHSGVLFRKMKRTMGSCKKNGMLTFNTRLKYMSEDIIDYIVFHELLHIKIKGGHNRAFRKKIKEQFPNYKILNEQISRYLLKINNEEI
jgi:predicted metal-dependent hydrolase